MTSVPRPHLQSRIRGRLTHSAGCWCRAMVHHEVSTGLCLDPPRSWSHALDEPCEICDRLEIADAKS